MTRRPIALALAVPLFAGCVTALDPREDEIASVVAEADLALIRERPLLIAGKYARMASDPYEFYRGNLPLYLHDWQNGAFGLAATRYGSTVQPEPLALGDAHPENFGLLEAGDGSFALEPNDFDSADRAPYTWDVRRLVIGLALAAQLANPDDDVARATSAAASRDVARAGALAYARAIASLAAGAPGARFDDPGAGAVLAHLFEKAGEDLAARQELLDDTVLEAGSRRLRRGVLSPDEPTQAFEDLSPDALEALPALVDAYRGTLLDVQPAEDLAVLDAVREFGSGVASWPRVRVIVLVRGPGDDPDDDLLLEVKELSDSVLPPRPPPDVAFDDVDGRVLTTSRLAWATPDASPLWGTASLLGLPVQVRLESDAQEKVRVSKLTGDRGTPEALEDLAATLGQLLARVHASPIAPGEEPAVAIANAIGADDQGFADEQAEVAVSARPKRSKSCITCAAYPTALGPRLGVPYDAADEPPPDLAALYGVPPEATGGSTP